MAVNPLFTKQGRHNGWLDSSDSGKNIIADWIQGANKVDFHKIFQISWPDDVILAWKTVFCRNSYVLKRKLRNSSTQQRCYRLDITAEFISIGYRSPIDPLWMKVRTRQRRLTVNAMCRTLTVPTSSVSKPSGAYSIDHKPPLLLYNKE
jgi:hypothetical protein